MNAPRSGDPDDEALAGYASALADAVDAALPLWVERVVLQRIGEWGGTVGAGVRAAIDDAAAQALVEVGAAVRALLLTDIDRQRDSPLAILRGAVLYPSGVLERAGVPHVVRDPMAERQFPDDVYGVAPASFAEIAPALHDPGLAWGAAKAHVHLKRRRAERS